MAPEALELLESRLRRLRAEHDGHLLSAGAAAMRTFDPMKKTTYGSSVGEYMRVVGAAVSEYEKKTRTEIMTLAEQLLSPMTNETKAELLAAAGRYLDKDLYPKRFAVHIESLDRSIGRSGELAGSWGIRSDLDAARHQAGTSSQIYRSLGQLSDDLELMRLRNSKLKSETKLEQANRLVKLEPNIFGFGFNLNYLIRRLLGKRE